MMTGKDWLDAVRGVSVACFGSAALVLLLWVVLLRIGTSVWAWPLW